jgi:mitochondrial fission protein ELM1
MSVVVWGITDGSAGMVSQVRGVGEMLVQKYGGEFILKSVRLKKPFCWLRGNWRFAAMQQLTRDSDTLSPPYPDILISSGRRSVALALAIKRSSGNKTKLVHLQGPRISTKYFDLVVAMEHDKLKGENVISTFAALHHITDAKLAEAHATYANQLTKYQSPRVAVLLGGSTHAYTLTPTHAEELAARVCEVIQQHKGSLWISTSRRTGAENIKTLRNILTSREDSHITIYSGDGENPYLAWLACADIIIVTNDSVSMMSEALCTGKPLYILPLPDHRNTKPANFANTLIERGYAKPFNPKLEPYQAIKLDEKETVVLEIIRRLCA